MSCIYYFFYNEVLRDALPECGGAKDTYNRNKTFNLKIDFLRTENIHTSPSPLWFIVTIIIILFGVYRKTLGSDYHSLISNRNDPAT